MLGIFYAALREQNLKIQVGTNADFVRRFIFKEETGTFIFVTAEEIEIEMSYPSYQVEVNGTILILR